MFVKRKIGIVTLFFLSLNLGLLGNFFKELDKSVQGTVGYRTGDFDWSIAGINNTPNVLSELNWNDLEIYQLKARGDASYEDTYCLRAFVTLGSVVDGKNQDSDYSGNNRTREFSRSNNQVTGNDIFEIKVGGGYRFDLKKEKESWAVQLLPMAGLSYHVLHLNIVEGYQTIPNTGSFSNLNSSYRGRWTGWWYGLEFRAQPNKNWDIRFSWDHHDADYFSEANWNLRNDFTHPVSFENETDARGEIVELTLRCQLNTDWFLVANVDEQKWDSSRGRNTKYLSRGGTSVNELNGVNWESQSFNLGCGYQF